MTETLTNDDVMQYLSFARCAAYVLDPSDVIAFARTHKLTINDKYIRDEFETLRYNPGSLGLSPLNI
jgi:hypothetical protein